MDRPEWTRRRSAIGVLACLLMANACSQESPTTRVPESAIPGAGGSSGGGSGTGGGSATTSAGQYVLWTRATQMLPLAVASGTQNLGSITASMTSAPACNAAGALTVPAPASGQLLVTVYNNSSFGNTVIGLDARAGCTPVEIQYTPGTLSIVATGRGSGVVRSASGAIDCTITNGKVAATGCAVQRTRGTVFTLRATPSAGSQFDGYQSGVCLSSGADVDCGVTLADVATSVGVSFGQAVVRDTLWFGAQWNRLGGTAGVGVVTVPSLSLDCRTPSPTQTQACFALVPRGSKVTLAATGLSGASFVGWSQFTRSATQCTAVSATTCDVTMRGPTAVQNGTEFALALFNPVSPTGQLSVWTDYSQVIAVTIDGDPVGNVPQFFSSGVPACGQPGTLTVTLPAGAHQVAGTSSSPAVNWASTSVTVVANSCTPWKLFAPAGGGGSTGGGGSGGGGSGSGSTNCFETRTINPMQPGSKTAWFASARWPNLDYQVVVDTSIYSNNRYRYQLNVRNRYSQSAWVAAAVRAGTVATHSSYRDGPIAPNGAVLSDLAVAIDPVGTTVYIYVDLVRVGAADSGPYFCP